MQNSPMKDSEIITPLPSLIRRIGGDNAKQAKQLALESGCQLKRIRRSRNWQLVGELADLNGLLQDLKNLESEDFRYLTTKLEQGLSHYQDLLEPKAQRLSRILKDKPNATLAELIALTDCTMAEARQARFDAEI
ncbi:ribosome recycling factor family protein [Agarivorans aestuarii]|uniref:Ribosome recycling factor family protein n=1 Tax=Agarivorans aestuarii TaxID=1563703 RepID=A0ABU7G6D9_9ALTE|nr:MULTISPECIES: ribosome recycling factor family protein [Agarivorans]MEE1674816.1 ribosome recycling factor family protein [Agarivorans aestuarii]